ncbi:MAG: phosphoribosylamine--glycine ligase [Gemmatimonadota bacterium]
MKVLLLGGGGREHALLWKLQRDHPEHDYLIAPGNGGTGAWARTVDVAPADGPGLLGLAAAEGVDFTIVGPEAPLAAGVVDAFRRARRPIFGPARSAARIETSKAFAKQLMREAGVATARFGVFRERDGAAAFAAELGVPCVIKASGLAAGKGALVCATQAEVDAALDACFVARAFGAAGDEVVVEEFLIGEEVSLLALTDGEHVLPLLPAQDHKRAEDGERGPNTGGMGACAPVSCLDAAEVAEVVERIFRPTLAALADAGAPFTGCLYAGLMLTASGPVVLEWNARFGDPETQALLPLLESDLLELLLGTATPRGLAGAAARWTPGTAVTVVAAADGYPGPYATGQPLDLPATLAKTEDVVVFHAGTRRDGARLVTAGGRVLTVTGLGADVAAARQSAYAALDQIGSQGLRWRTDIG